ncbi:MAG TPA: PEP-CTERM sorting domain-containing protein [Nitrosospira sp.]|jgi:hypothetical protein|nr:PEP-CTERM sorting domain-containing protein [Nitrosospira sp.]
MKRLIFIAALLGLTLTLAIGQASANVMYMFSGVTFADGGTLTGTFTTNDPITALVDFDITTSPGVGIGFHYTPATAGSSSTALPSILVLSDASLDNILQVTLNSLSAAGSPITIGSFDSFEQTPLSHRDIVAGQVVAVPEPKTYALLLVGIGLLGWRMRRT